MILNKSGVAAKPWRRCGEWGQGRLNDQGLIDHVELPCHKPELA